MSIDVNVQNDLVIVTESSEDIVVNVSNAAGAPGPAGAPGANGVGVPVGGATGQVLKKFTNTDFDTYWAADASGLTSVGLSMPTAFTVSNTPLTTNGTIAVTGAGTAAQYVRGDGQLATFPSTASGGSSVNYYLNGSVNASVAGYKQLANTATIGGGTDFTLVGNGLIAQFLTDAGNPNRVEIPGGAWNFEMFFQVSSSGGNQKFYVELLKYNGTTFTSIASSSAVPEEITGGTSIDLYLTSLAVPTTALLVTDRLAIRVYIVDNAVGRTITLHTEDNTLCEIITTFAGGIAALNGLSANTQYLATGTSGTDFNISSLTDTHTFNLPTASATNRGALSSTDWSSFSGKVGGSGVAGQVAYWNGTNSQTGSSNFVWDNANARLGIGIAVPKKSIDLLNAIGVTHTASTGYSEYVFYEGATAQASILTTGSVVGTYGGANSLNLISLTAAPISFFLNNITRLATITTTGLGVNLIAPKHSIDALNEIAVTHSVTNAYSQVIFYENTTAQTGLFTCGSTQTLYGGANSFNILNLLSAPITFSTNNTERMRLTAAGRLLLGTTSESTFLLDVNGTARVSGNVQFGTGLYWDNTNARLGIGTATPQNNLDVVRGTAGTMARDLYESASFSYNGESKIGFYTSSSNSAHGSAIVFGQTNLQASGAFPGFEMQYVYNSTIASNSWRLNYIGRGGTGLVVNYAANLLNVYADGTVILNPVTLGISATPKLIIGTSSVSTFMLDVNGTARVSGVLSTGNGTGYGHSGQVVYSTSSSSNAYFEASSASGAFAALTFTKAGVLSTMWQLGANDANNFYIFRNGVNKEIFKIFESTKNVGIDEVSGGSTFSDVVSAKLFVNSTTKGFLPPRMTTTEKNAIASPATGLQVYDTTLGSLNVYNGSSWVALGAGGGGSVDELQVALLSQVYG